MSHPHGQATPAPIHNRPGLPRLRYRVGDHGRFRRAMVEALPRAFVADQAPLRALTARDDGDPAMALLDAWAVACDVLTFYQERIANEAYLRTTAQPARVAAVVGHRSAPGCAAATLLAFTIDHDQPVDLPAGLQVQTVPDPGQKPALFETMEPLRAHRGLNRVAARATWPQPPAGKARQAWLVGTKTGLRKGDTVLLVAGPGAWHLRTLTQVDALDGRTRVAWDAALPDGTPPLAVHAVEREARGFGHNAPRWTDLQRLFDAAQAVPPPPKGYDAYVKAWGTIHFFDASPADTSPTPKRPLDLDSRYPIRPDSWAMLVNDDGTKRQLLRVQAVAEVSRQDYQVAATVTRLTTDPPLPATPTDFPVASSKLLAFGPALPQAEGPAPILRAGGVALDLDGDHPAFHDGRRLVLEGRRVRVHKGFAGPPVTFPDPVFAPTLKASGAVRLVRVELGGAPVFLLKAPQNLGDKAEPFDVLLAGAWAGKAPGYAIQASDATVHGKGAPVQAHVLYVDADNDGGYGRGDAVYLSSSPAGLVATKDADFSLRLTGPEAGTLVLKDQADLVASGHAARAGLSPDGPPGLALFDADGDGLFHAGRDRLYLTPGPVAEGSLVPPAAVRLHGGTFGSQVGFGDQDHPVLPTAALAGGAAGERIEPLDMGTEAVEVAAVRRGDGGRTRLELAAGLLHDYDPATVVLHGNVAPATHGETQKPAALGSGEATAEHQAFALPKAPLTHVADPKGEHGVRPELLVRVGGVAWDGRPTLHGAAPDAAAYAVQRTADGTFVRFGDGDAGARLPTGTHNVTALYRQGLGRAGNARAGQVRNLKDKPKGLKAAANPVPATGGVDPESTDTTRAAAPESVLVLDRVVSLRDHEDAARAYVGVAQTRARMAWHGGERVVELTIVGDDGERLPAGHPLRASLMGYLDARRDPHQAVRLRAHEPVPLTIAVRIDADPRHDAEVVRAAARAILLERFAFGHGELGGPVQASDLLELLHRVPGLVGAHLLRLSRGAAADAPARLPMAAHELATLDPRDLRVLLRGEPA
ncbi:MAG: hypothetical protein QOD77_282 [Thermoplasmata archaeon]|jgi:hypothetical protein|nr:hypothetical protein [Thermoplasmata archaeon]